MKLTQPLLVSLEYDLQTDLLVFFKVKVEVQAWHTLQVTALSLSPWTAGSTEAGLALVTESVHPRASITCLYGIWHNLSPLLAT